jgi:hypothetical protein
MNYKKLFLLIIIVLLFLFVFLFINNNSNNNLENDFKKTGYFTLFDKVKDLFNNSENESVSSYKDKNKYFLEIDHLSIKNNQESFNNPNFSIAYTYKDNNCSSLIYRYLLNEKDSKDIRENYFKLKKSQINLELIKDISLEMDTSILREKIPFDFSDPRQLNFAVLNLNENYKENSVYYPHLTSIKTNSFERYYILRDEYNKTGIYNPYNTLIDKKNEILLYSDRYMPVFLLNERYDYSSLTEEEKEIIDYYKKYEIENKYDLVRRTPQELCKIFDEDILQSFIEKRYFIPRDYLIKYTAVAENVNLGLESSFEFTDSIQRPIAYVNINKPGVVIYPEDMNKEEYKEVNGNLQFYEQDTGYGLEDIAEFIAQEKGFEKIPVKNYLKFKSFEKIGQYDFIKRSVSHPNIIMNLKQFYFLDDIYSVESSKIGGLNSVQLDEPDNFFKNYQNNNFIRMVFTLKDTTGLFYNDNFFKTNIFDKFQKEYYTLNFLNGRYLNLKYLFVKKYIEVDNKVNVDRFYYDSRYALFNVYKNNYSATNMPFMIHFNNLDEKEISFSIYLLQPGSAKKIDSLEKYNCPEDDPVFIDSTSFARCLSNDLETYKDIVIYFDKSLDSYVSFEIYDKIDFVYPMQVKINENIELQITYKNNNQLFDYYLKDKVNNKIYLSKEIGNYYTTDSIDYRTINLSNSVNIYNSLYDDYISNNIFVYKRIDFKEKENKGKVKLYPFFVENINNIPISIEEFETDNKLATINIDNHTFKYNYYNDSFYDLKFNRLVDVNNLEYSEDFNLISEIIVYNNSEKEKFYQENKVTENIDFQTNFYHKKQTINLVENIDLEVMFYDDMEMAYKINCKNTNYPFCFTDPLFSFAEESESTFSNDDKIINKNLISDFPEIFRDQSEEIILKNKNYFFIDQIKIKNNPPGIDMNYQFKCDYTSSSGNTINETFFRTGSMTDNASNSSGINSFAYYRNNYSLTTFSLFKNSFSHISNDDIIKLYKFINLQLFNFNNQIHLCNVSDVYGKPKIEFTSCVSEGEKRSFSQEVRERIRNDFIEKCNVDLEVSKIDVNNTKNLTIDYIPSDKFNDYYASLEKEDIIFNNYNQEHNKLLLKDIEASIVFIKYKNERVYPLIENQEITFKEKHKSYFPEKYIQTYSNNKFVEIGIVVNSELKILPLPIKEINKRDDGYYAIFEDTFVNLESLNEDITVLWHVKEIKLPYLEFEVSFIDNFKNTIVESSNFETAKKIKDFVQEKYNADPFKYLLILGDFDIIPAVTSRDVSSTRAGGYLSLYNLNLSDEHNFNYVLDSLYYGNIDDNPDVDLSVGRLPFREENEYLLYYHNILKHLKPKSKSSYIIYPDKSYILSSERIISKYNDIRVYVTLPFNKEYKAENIQTVNSGIFDKLLPDSYKITSKEKFSLDLFLSPLKEELLTHFSKSDQIYFTTHGNLNYFTLTDIKGRLNDYLTVESLPYFINRPIIFAQSCSTARFMGKNFLNKGIKGYVGAYNPLFVNYDVFPLTSGSVKIADLIKYHQNFYINSPHDKRDGIESIIYLGDPTIEYKPIISANNDGFGINTKLDYDIDLKDKKIIFTEDLEDIFSFGFYNRFLADEEGFYTYLDGFEKSNLTSNKLINRTDTFRYSIEYMEDVHFPCNTNLEYFYVPNDRGETYFVNSVKKYDSSKNVVDYSSDHFKEIITIMKEDLKISENVSVFIKESSIACGELAMFLEKKPIVEIPIWKKFYFFFDDEKRIFYNVNDGPIQMYGKLREDVEVPSKLNVKWYNSDILLKEETIDLYQYDEKTKSKNTFQIIFTYKDFYNFLKAHKPNLGTRLEISGVWEVTS